MSVTNILNFGIKPNKKKKELISDYRLTTFSAISLSGATILGKCVVAPLDRLKIIQQLQPCFQCVNSNPLSLSNSPTIGTLSCKIFKTQRFSSFWWGFKPQLLNIFHSNTIRLFSLQKLYTTCAYPPQDFITGNCTALQKIPLIMCASSLALTLSYPLDTAYTLFSSNQNKPSERKKQNKSITKFFYTTLRSSGFLSLYRGYSLGLLTLIPYITISVATHDLLKSSLMHMKWPINYPNNIINSNVLGNHKLDDIINNIEDDKSVCNEKLDSRILFTAKPSLPLYHTLAIGFFSGLIAQSITYPMDTVRRRLQYNFVNQTKQPQNYRYYIQMMRNKGIKDAYRGYGCYLLKFLPESVIIGISFVVIQQMINTSSIL